MTSSRRTAAFAAGLVAPVTFEASLMPRSTVQQGLVTGLSTVATVASVKASQAAVTGLAGPFGSEARETTRGRLAVQALALLASAGTQVMVRRRDGEVLRRAALRTASYQTGLGSAAALATSLLHLDDRGGGRLARAAGDVGTVAAAALASVVVDLPSRRKAGVSGWSLPSVKEALASVATAAGVSTGVLTAAALEQAASRAVGRTFARRLPGPAQAWATVGQVAVGAAAAAVAVHSANRVLAGIEQAAEVAEAGIDQPPTDPYVSGGPHSGVSFASLSREGRRHVLTRVRPATIEEVTGAVATAEPVRVFVGLESAPSVEARVQLALDEIDRLGALDRSLLVLVSPTGSGYVNYAAMQAIELLALGDVSSVVMQYCLRPSFLSLDHVALGRQQNSMLWHAISRRLAERPPELRPRMVMFGESLGAHTSQDVVLDQGTAGLQSLGVDSAVWIGTPFASKWKDQVLGPQRPDVERSLVGLFASFEQYQALPPERRQQVRYAMVSHYEDGVPKFGWPVSIQQPAWITHRDPRDTTATMRWRPFVTFFQVFVDMLNGSNVTPGVFAALGHDYRSDLLDFIHAVYRLDATTEQLASIRDALPHFEAVLFGYLDAARAAAAGPEHPPA